MEIKPIRLTQQSLRVLAALYQARNYELSGAQVGAETNLMSGTLYPILARFEASGLAKSRWEEDSPSLRKPRRRFYQLTAAGQRQYQSAISEIYQPSGGFAWKT